MRKIKAAVLKCAKCKWYTGFKSSKGGVNHIDTICGVCGRRLRYTRRWHDLRELKTVAPAYAKGSGAHNRTNSVSRIRFVPAGVVKLEASKMNKDLQRAIAKRDDIDLDEILQGSESLEAGSESLEVNPQSD